MSNVNEAQNLNHYEFKIGEQQVKVGRIFNYDQTDRYAYSTIGFEKTITLVKSFRLQGQIHLADECIYKTSEYLYGFEPLELVIARHRKLGVGIATLEAEIETSPVIMLPKKPDDYCEKYFPVPLDWIDITTEEGEEFFKVFAEIHKSRETGGERLEAMLEANTIRNTRFSFNRKKEKRVLYRSDMSFEENCKTLTAFLDENHQKYDQKDIEEILIPAEKV